MNFNEQQARFYAKSGCKKCMGKGFLEYSQPSNTKGFNNIRQIYCVCALKQMKVTTK